MKKLLIGALLVSLNLYPMDCFNKPYKSKKQHHSKLYTKLIPTKKRTHKKKNQDGCFATISRYIIVKSHYQNH